jgi:DNA-binding MarR family transcriptional regulator
VSRDHGALPGAAAGGPVSHTLARVARLHRIAAGRLLNGLGLHPGQESLMMLWDSGPMRQSKLVKSLALAPSAVTKMVQRLGRCDVVRRRQESEDRRAVLAATTGKGQALRAGVEDAWSELEEATLRGLDLRDEEEMTRLLGLLEANLFPGAARQEDPPRGE